MHGLPLLLLVQRAVDKGSAVLIPLQLVEGLQVDRHMGLLLIGREIRGRGHVSEQVSLFDHSELGDEGDEVLAFGDHVVD